MVRTSLSALQRMVGCVLAVTGLFAVLPIGGASAIVDPNNEPGAAGAPYAVSVLANVDAGVFDPQIYCSGALIAPDLVLTAAHCATGLDPAAFHVGAGSEDIREMTLHPVVDLIVHPAFDPDEGRSLNPLGDDLALLLLASPVKGVTPIRLAPVKDGPLRGPRSNLRSYGWGVDRAGAPSGWLGRAAQVDITSTRESPYAPLNIAKQILARSRRGALPCIGDSGGPLVGNRPGKKVPYLVGLTSYGSEDCDVTMPIVYTRIAGYRPWIAAASKALRERAPLRRLTYLATDRAWSPPEGTPVLTGELVSSRNSVAVTLTAPDLGAVHEPRLLVRVPSSGLAVRDGEPLGTLRAGACIVEHGDDRSEGFRTWWMRVSPACLGLDGRGRDVLAELVRDGHVLDEIHFTRVLLP
jgi:hypothetical protein